MGITLLSREEKAPFEIEEVERYDLIIKTPETSLAKTYENQTELNVMLLIPKKKWKEKNVQTLLEWGKKAITEEGYYRDLAIQVKARGGAERAIVFTHAQVEVTVIVETQKLYMKVEVRARQKGDKAAGVVLGEGLEESYKKAWERVENPPKLNRKLQFKDYVQESSKERVNMGKADFYVNGKKAHTLEIIEEGFENKEKKKKYRTKEIFSLGY